MSVPALYFILFPVFISFQPEPVELPSPVNLSAARAPGLDREQQPAGQPAGGNRQDAEPHGAGRQLQRDHPLARPDRGSRRTQVTQPETESPAGSPSR